MANSQRYTEKKHFNPKIKELVFGVAPRGKIRIPAHNDNKVLLVWINHDLAIRVFMVTYEGPGVLMAIEDTRGKVDYVIVHRW